MKEYKKPSIGKREKLTHRFLHYICNRTSSKYPEWRDNTIDFLFQLFELMNDNPGLNVLIKRDDGLYIYLGSDPIAYLHFYQRHFLIHSKSDYLIWNIGDKIFKTSHNGSWPRMWKVNSREEVTDFLSYLGELPTKSLSEDNKASRTIPVWVQEFVFERDAGHCVSCGSKINLCFDHILPFSKGGGSKHPNNIQLLCSKCNSEKSDNFGLSRVQSNG